MRGTAYSTKYLLLVLLAFFRIIQVHCFSNPSDFLLHRQRHNIRSTFQLSDFRRNSIPSSSASFSAAPDTSSSRTEPSNFFNCLDERLKSALQDKLGVTAPNSIQMQALEAALNGNNVVTIAQTGSGKTLTFLLPMLQQQMNNSPCECVVIAPNELLLEQHAHVAQQLYPQNRIQFWTLQDYLHAAKSQKSNDMDNEHKQSIPPCKTMMIALDEVDVMLYGHCNSPDLTEQGAQLLDKIQLTNSSSSMPQNVQCIATTAYLSREHEQALLTRDFANSVTVRESQQERSAASHAHAHQQQPTIGSNRMGWLVPTLRQKFHYFSSQNKQEKLWKVLQDEFNDSFLNQGSTILFCQSVETNQQLFHLLQDRYNSNTQVPANENKKKNEKRNENDNSPPQVLYLHEEMDKSTLQTTIQTLRQQTSTKPISTMNRRTLLIATDMAARGLDVPNVRHVILYDVPTDISSFIHQAGRTARRGQSGLLTCLVKAQSNEMGRYQQLHALKDAAKLTFS